MSGPRTIQGSFKIAETVSSRSADPLTVKLDNIVDGSGSAVLLTTPFRSPDNSSVPAGSNDQVIWVEFTAAGAMNNGQVSVELPSGWGGFSTDGFKHNYVRVQQVMPGRFTGS